MANEELIKELILRLNDCIIGGTFPHWKTPEQMSAECAAVLQSCATEIAELKQEIVRHKQYIFACTDDIERALRRPKP